MEKIHCERKYFAGTSSYLRIKRLTTRWKKNVTSLIPGNGTVVTNKSNNNNCNCKRKKLLKKSTNKEEWHHRPTQFQAETCPWNK